MADVTGLDEVLQVLDRLGKEAPKALADAINHTSNQSRIALKQEMQSVFTSPTPFTLNAIAVDVARPAGDPEGAVFVKDMAGGKNQSPTDWLEPQVFGGERQACVAREITKHFETYLTASLAELLEQVTADPNQQKGEFVLLVEGFTGESPDVAWAEACRWLNELKEVMPPSKASALVARMTGVKKKDLYQGLLDSGFVSKA